MGATVLEEDWGISPERIRQFFRQQAGARETEDGFLWGSCRITLTPHQKALMDKWPQQRTLIRIEGPEAEASWIHRCFFLQFLSAGG